MAVAFVFALLKWGLIIVSVGFFFSAMADADTAIQEATIAGMACFGGILARLAQAEEHNALERMEASAEPPSDVAESPHATELQ